MTWRTAVVFGWFVLALFVMSRLFQNADVLTTLAAWAGGCLSVYFGEFLHDIWRARRRKATP